MSAFLWPYLAVVYWDKEEKSPHWEEEKRPCGTGLLCFAERESYSVQSLERAIECRMEK